MATWKISNYHKKNAVERQFWVKDGKTIIREEGYRWGTWYCESDEKPDIDLKNPEGFEVGYSDDYEWELDSMDDGCWADTQAGQNASLDDVAEFDQAWEDEDYEGVEALGWSNNDTEQWIYGPLQLINQDTNEEFNGEEK